MKRRPSAAPDIPGLDFVRLLGTGGFSDVFLYEQQLPRRRVAVKVLLTEGLNTAARRAFVDEANLMAQLSAHPYIVTIFHADVAPDDRPYFLMEYCSGPNLSDLYKKEPFSVPDALRTGVRLSSAIATAHAAGILHRDIKPANVLTNDFGWPALTDFGISSAVEDELPGATTAARLADEPAVGEANTIGMSVPWSPPEMFDDDPHPDVRSDVFSLAATIHTLLAGRTPFEIPGRPNGSLDLIGRIERGAVTPIGRPEIPASLTAVLLKGMASRRTERYNTVVEFARALQRVELELGFAPTPIEVPRVVLQDADSDNAATAETRVRSAGEIPEPTPLRSVGPAAEETVLRADHTPAPAANHPAANDPAANDPAAEAAVVSAPSSASAAAPAANPRSIMPSFAVPSWPAIPDEGTLVQSFASTDSGDGTVVRPISSPSTQTINPGANTTNNGADATELGYQPAAPPRAAAATSSASDDEYLPEEQGRRWFVPVVVGLFIVMVVGAIIAIAIGLSGSQQDGAASAEAVFAGAGRETSAHTSFEIDLTEFVVASEDRTQ